MQMDYTGKDTWITLHPEVYRTRHGTFVVPSRFKTDLASTPRILWPLFPPFGSYAHAAVLHDWLYTTGVLQSRKASDDVLREVMVQDGVAVWKRFVIYWAVRLFGAGHYGGNG